VHARTRTLHPTVQDFYQNVVLQKLNPGGIFITQSGPAGFLSCTEVFTCINATLRSVFPHVLPYTQHMPVFCDVWGWNMALTDPQQAGQLSPDEMDARLAARVEGPMRFLDGHTFAGLCHINKHVRRCAARQAGVAAAVQACACTPSLLCSPTTCSRVLLQVPGGGEAGVHRGVCALHPRQRQQRQGTRRRCGLGRAAGGQTLCACVVTCARGLFSSMNLHETARP
jgi:hypothetical protein